MSEVKATEQLCPHGMPLAANTCGPCSQGRPNAPLATDPVMDERTLEALRGSIRKWEGIVAGKHGDLGGSDCPLCELFAHKRDACAGCPVAEATDRRHCDDTPYYEYRDGPAAQRQENAERMLNFLKSLLPKDAT